MDTAATPHSNYLTDGYGLKSWLLTKDHKRIGLLYLISVSAFFVLGAVFAGLIRLELLTPAGDLVESDVYNRLFTMHGVIMVFFFLIPAIPSVLGNFLVPIMIGAKDLAFPRLNLLSWYVYTIGGTFTLWALVNGGVDTGWTFYTPYSSAFSNSNVALVVVGIFINGFSSILTGPELHRHHPQDARAGDDVVPPPALHLGALRDGADHGARHAGDCDYPPDGAAPSGSCTWGSSTRSSAGIRCSSSTCSGSTRTPRSTS